MSRWGGLRTARTLHTSRLLPRRVSFLSLSSTLFTTHLYEHRRVCRILTWRFHFTCIIARYVGTTASAAEDGQCRTSECSSYSRTSSTTTCTTPITAELKSNCEYFVSFHYLLDFRFRSVAPRSCELVVVSLPLSSLARIYQTTKPTRSHYLHIYLLACFKFNTLVHLTSSVITH
jgi:hypothetical protein